MHSSIQIKGLAVAIVDPNDIDKTVYPCEDGRTTLASCCVYCIKNKTVRCVYYFAFADKGLKYGSVMRTCVLLFSRVSYDLHFCLFQLLDKTKRRVLVEIHISF
jgi:hypothetical protein